VNQCRPAADWRPFDPVFGHSVLRPAEPRRPANERFLLLVSSADLSTIIKTH
jgi:hypothetical protein